LLSIVTVDWRARFHRLEVRAANWNAAQAAERLDPALRARLAPFFELSPAEFPGRFVRPARVTTYGFADTLMKRLTALESREVISARTDIGCKPYG